MTTPLEKLDQIVGTELLGRFRVESSYSAGGMSALFKGLDQETGKEVAIRMMHLERRPDKNAITRFQNAARAMQKLSHPHLTPLLASGVTSARVPFLIYEFVRANSLRDELATNKKIDPERTREIAMQAASALNQAHGVGVVHRNLKPGNILLRQDEAGEIDAVVTGFGIARQFMMSTHTLANITQTKKVVGSPTYMSPEQFASANVDQRSDVYSFGCVLYELLAGRPPFQASSYLSTAAMHSFEWPDSLQKLNAEVPPYLESIVVACMQKKPEDRYQSMLELQEDLEKKKCRFGDRVFEGVTRDIPSAKQHKESGSKWMIAAVVGSLACAAVVAAIMMAPAPKKPAVEIPAYLEDPSVASSQIVTESSSVVQSTYPQMDELLALQYMQQAQWRAADVVLSRLLAVRDGYIFPDGKISQLYIERACTFAMQHRYAEADIDLGKARLAPNNPILGCTLYQLAHAPKNQFPLADYYARRMSDFGYANASTDSSRLRASIDTAIDELQEARKQPN